MAAGDGLVTLVTPCSTSQFESMTTDAQAHFNALRGQLEVIAYDLRRLLPRAKNVNGRMPWGLDLQLSARQIARQFTQAAAAQNSASAAVAKALTIYHGNFTSGSASASAGQFDAGR
jgi:hypothetical protein